MAAGWKGTLSWSYRLSRGAENKGRSLATLGDPSPVCHCAWLAPRRLPTRHEHKMQIPPLESSFHKVCTLTYRGCRSRLWGAVTQSRKCSWWPHAAPRIITVRVVVFPTHILQGVSSPVAGHVLSFPYPPTYARGAAMTVAFCAGAGEPQPTGQMQSPVCSGK